MLKSRSGQHVQFLTLTNLGDKLLTLQNFLESSMTKWTAWLDSPQLLHISTQRRLYSLQHPFFHPKILKHKFLSLQLTAD